MTTVDAAAVVAEARTRGAVNLQRSPSGKHPRGGTFSGMIDSIASACRGRSSTQQLYSARGRGPC